MDTNKDLYHFFLDKTWQLTEEWYANLDKSDPAGVYASTDPEAIKAVKQQNYAFHVKFSEVFNKEKSTFLADFENWILMVAQDEEHAQTPLHFIIREFHRTQNQYLDLITEFIETHNEQYSLNEFNSMFRLVTDTMSYVIEWFTEEYNRHAVKRLAAQQELILELSTPVIALSKEVALLPLVGEIDTARAKILHERTLTECSRLGVNRLLLDLSGVVFVDTMVAQQIFQLIDALRLIGVSTSLSGIRPEVAQTAIQLGLSFDNICINSSLAKSIKLAKI
ncbi:STAS domain-containing protein [Bacillus sp. T33-2]|uniref:STAS domain-containing protein n=1 Tax=Bacillus sp. T33-2 TaxID=2054168 RepID=UPI000C760808|nr:STAS domain-containing protein [Bacillus sp. T33-2]PLR89988.1 RsbT co-antagonist protein RsbRB [Bacillus sp. T33-2]